MTSTVVAYTGWGATGSTWGVQTWGQTTGSIDIVGTGAIGTVTVEIDVAVVPTGAYGIGVVGTVAVDLRTTAELTGVYATGCVVQFSGWGACNTTWGYQGWGVSEGVNTLQSTSNVVPVLGFSAIGYVGSVTTTQGATAYPTSVYALGEVGNLNIWGIIDTTQNANWRRIAA